jgi:hypothetical protein
MIVDALTEVSTAQSLAGGGIFTLSTNVIDLGKKVDWGRGKQLYMMFVVTTAFVVNVPTPSLGLGWGAADSPDLLTNPVELGKTAGPFTAGPESPVLLAPVLTLGRIFYVPLLPLSIGTAGDNTFAGGVAGYMKRYLAGVYRQPQSGTASFSAGSITARIVEQAFIDQSNQDIYRGGFAVI